MRAMTLCRVGIIVALTLAAAPVGPGPRHVVQRFIAAMEAGDRKAVTECVVEYEGDRRKTSDNLIDTMLLQQELANEVRRQWGDEARNSTPVRMQEKRNAYLDRLVERVDKAQLAVSGDTAALRLLDTETEWKNESLIEREVHLKRIEGEWKIDVPGPVFGEDAKPSVKVLVDGEIVEGLGEVLGGLRELIDAVRMGRFHNFQHFARLYKAFERGDIAHVSAALPPATQAAGTRELSPEEVLLSYIDALKRGDERAAREHLAAATVAELKLAEFFAGAWAIRPAVTNVLKKRFGDDALKASVAKTASEELKYLDSLCDALQSADPVIQGNSAKVAISPIEESSRNWKAFSLIQDQTFLTRTDAGWKIDIRQTLRYNRAEDVLNDPFFESMAEDLRKAKSLFEDLKAGKFKTVEAFERAAR